MFVMLVMLGVRGRNCILLRGVVQCGVQVLCDAIQVQRCICNEPCMCHHPCPSLVALKQPISPVRPICNFVLLSYFA
jgi:hypothetical protein